MEEQFFLYTNQRDISWTKCSNVANKNEQIKLHTSKQKITPLLNDRLYKRRLFRCRPNK